MGRRKNSRKPCVASETKTETGGGSGEGWDRSNER